MSTPPLSLAACYQGWNTYQEQLVAALQPLTTEQLSLHAAPHLRSVGMLATHIIEVRAGWFYYVLNERDERLVEFTRWGEREQTTWITNELVRGLAMTWQVLYAGLARWTTDDWETIFWDIDDKGEPTVPYTRQWILWHLLEHDMHHGGELSFTLGLHQLPAVDL